MDFWVQVKSFESYFQLFEQKAVLYYYMGNVHEGVTMLS